MKKFTNALISLILIISVFFTMAVGTSTSVSAGIFKTKAADKLIEIGVRIACEITIGVGECTGVEEIENTTSFIAKWLLMDASEAAAAQAVELCEEILDRLDEIEEEMEQSFTELERILGSQNVTAEKTKLDDQWETDVDNVISSFDATSALTAYKEYMTEAIRCKTLQINNPSVTDEYITESLSDEYVNLLHAYSYMYDENIPVGSYNTEDLEELLFSGNAVNRKFINLIEALSQNLVKENSASVVCHAAQFAYSKYPFSHDQYTFVKTMMEKQIMELMMVELIYNEYLYHQGVYLSEYGTNKEKDGFMELQGDFSNKLDEVSDRIGAMIDAEMEVDTVNGTTLSFNDYMRPEDLNATLSVKNYRDHISYKLAYDEYENWYTSSYANYIRSNNQFYRLVVNGKVFYILNPNQFSSSNAVHVPNLDYKYDISTFPDVHLTSCDYQNLISTMSDGLNTFACSGKDDWSKFYDLFNTNAYSLVSKNPSVYLGKYLYKSGANLFFLTNVHENPDYVPTRVESTAYEDIGFVYGNSNPFSGKGLNEDSYEEISGKHFQRDGKYDDYQYTIILANTSNTYEQKVNWTRKGNGVTDFYITYKDENGNDTKYDPNYVYYPAKATQILTLHFKIDDAYALDSLKCKRSGASESVLLESNDLRFLEQDENGYYTFDYPMPYSQTLFELSATTLKPENEVTYEISNADELMAFAERVNGGNYDCRGTLTDDIDLSGYNWTPIANNPNNPFTGIFNGNGHTISNMTITTANNGSGLFGFSAGTIKNVTVDGNITFTQAAEHAGGVVGSVSGGKVHNVVSYVNIKGVSSAKDIKHVGGVIGSISNGTVDKALFYGDIYIPEGSHDCFGAVIGYAGSGAVIKNCGNLGKIETKQKGAYTGGILGYLNNSSVTVSNCYNNGKVNCIYTEYLTLDTWRDAHDNTYCGAIIGWLRNGDKNLITNNYYNESMSYPFGTGGITYIPAQSVTDEQLKSGEIAYKLNNGVSDGTQAWKQNIDNGLTPDSSPVHSGGTVYLNNQNNYSNYKDIEQNFTRDENGSLLIQSYEDLTTFSTVMNSDYDNYKSKTFVLTDNIFAPKDSVWTTGIGSSEKPFEGKFHGNGYGIMGLNIDSTELGGLFGVIGKNGKIDNLCIIDTDYISSNCETSGVIAAINNGTISECLSGINLTDAKSFYNSQTQEEITSEELKSNVVGINAGGIVGINNGTIEYSRNASATAGPDNCGGIAGLNNGTIYACANTATIGDRTSKISGGLVGTNTADIGSCYNSGEIKGKLSGNLGTVVGVNNVNEDEFTGVKNVFYTTTDIVNSIGKTSLTPLDNSNVKKLSTSLMQTDSFTDDINAVTKNKPWIRDKAHNEGYPTINSDYMNTFTRTSDNGITVRGAMHKDLQIEYYLCNSSHDSYKLLCDYAKDKTFKVYAPKITDKNNVEVPYEMWSKGGVEISIPTDKAVKVVGLNSENEITELETNIVDGNIVFTADKPIEFMVVDQNSSVNPPSFGGGSSTGNDTTNNDAVNTGDYIGSSSILSAMLLYSALIFIGALIMFTFIKRNNKQVK